MSQLHLKENGVRLTDLFRRMVAWAGEVPEKELLRITEGVLSSCVDTASPNGCSIVQQHIGKHRSDPEAAGLDV